MPAVFVADERGPQEPNIYMAFSKGRPNIDADLFLPSDVKNFLSFIWQRFGTYPTEKITTMTKKTRAFKYAKKRGNRAEIKLSDMQTSFNPERDTPRIKNLAKSKLYRTQAGKPVAVKAWTPGGKEPD